jgi:hypothetical protein
MLFKIIETLVVTIQFTAGESVGSFTAAIGGMKGLQPGGTLVPNKPIGSERGRQSLLLKRRQPVALAGFCANLYRKNHDLRTAANLRFDGVCRVKNRLIGAFLGFTREARQTPGEQEKLSNHTTTE